MAKKDARTGNDNNDQTDVDRTDDTDWKAEARKWEKRAKDNDAAAKTARDELEQLKQSSAPKSDLDKLTESVEKLTERAEKAERKALIADVAREYGLSTKQANRLKGNTREELEADAEDLAETFGITKSDKDGESQDGGDDKGGDKDRRGGQDDTSSGRRPKSRPKEPGAGGSGDGSGNDFDPKKVADDILGGP